MSCTYQNRLDYIADYVRGALPELEQETFEAHYLGCDECLANIRVMEKTVFAMRRYGASIFAPQITWSDRLKIWWEELPLSQQWKSAIPAFATYLVIIGALSTGYWWLKSSLPAGGFGHKESGEIATNVGNKSLTELKHFDWTQLTPNAAEPELVNRLAEIQPIYQEKKYPQAAEQLTEVVEKFPHSIEARLFLGISQLFLNHQNTRNAIQNLETIIQAHPDHAPARWYLAKGYIKENRFDEARQQLTALKKQNHYSFGPQAEQLLAKLNHLKK
jgi:predicted negative regulator of RcsB-dependent stress response